MRDKNQPNAQALNDDTLENVAGGFKYGEQGYTFDNKVVTFSLNPDERKYLLNNGFNYSPRNDSWTDSDGNPADPKHLAEILTDAGFTNTYGIGDLQLLS